MRFTKLFSFLALVPVAGCQCDDELARIPGTVLGQVCDEQGAPVANDLVRLVGTGSPPFERELLTDAQGKYAFDGVPAGAVTVFHPASLRQFPGIAESRKTITLEDTACRPLADGPGVSGVDGQICNRHTGSYVTQADVVVSTAGGRFFATTTDGDGRFAIEGVPAGEHILTVEAQGFSRAFLIEVVEGEIFHLALGEECTETDASQGTLSGILCDPDAADRGLAGAAVRVEDVSGVVVDDITDVGGAFFINALTPGLAKVDILRDGVQYRHYDVEVVAGQDVVVVVEDGCAEPPPPPRPPQLDCEYSVQIAPVTGARPVDIIFVIDDSGSMDDDNAAIAANMNAFSQQVAASGVDYRVILLGTTQVPAPLGGSAEYLHVVTDVDSEAGLRELLAHYVDYQAFLRPDSTKHFVAITDDESDIPSAQFANSVDTWPGFAGWTFHSIVAHGPLPEIGCETGEAISQQYINLTEQTGGVISPICGADYATVFDTVIEAVTAATLPCTISLLEGAPAGSVVDPYRVVVNYDGVSESADFSVCGIGWRFDDANNPTSITACPTTCADLAVSASGTIGVEIGCFTD